MDWTRRIREAFEAADRPVTDSVVEELADHAADLFDSLPEEDRHAAIDRQIALWVKSVSSRAVPAAAPMPTARTSWLTDLPCDLRYAARVLRRQPGPSLAGATTIAIGVAAVTVMAALVWGVLLRPLPWPDADRLVRLYESRKGGHDSFGQFGGLVTNGSYLAWRNAPATIGGLGAWSPGERTLTGSGAAERVGTASLTPSLLPVLGIGPSLGRAFRDDDASAGAAKTVLVSDAFWRQRLGARADALGATVRLDGQPHTVIGVMPDSFAFPDRDTSLWVPFDVRPTITPGSQNGSIQLFSAMARLKPGVSLEQASAEASARADAAPKAGPVAIAVFGSDGPAVMTLVPALENATREVRPALLVLLAAVGLLLLAAAGNVANVQLARAASRRRELAIRFALGADRRQVAWQLLLEGALIGAAGGLGGLLLAASVVAALPSLLPSDFPRVDQIRIDWLSAAVALTASIGAGTAAGLLPAWHARDFATHDALADDGRAPAGAGLRLPATRARAAMMAAQVAIATVLLVGAGLLAQSFIALLRADRGFETARVLTAELPIARGETPERRTAILDGVVDRLGGVPGVIAAGYTSILPLTNSESIRAFEMSGRQGQGRITARTGFRVVSPDYLTALGMRVVKGRGFESTDTATSQPVAVVNRAFVETYMDETPLGDVVPVGTDQRPDWTVVGIVEDVRTADGARTGPEVFVSSRQWPDADGGEPMIAVRTAGDPTSLTPVLRGIIRDIDPTLALGDVRTMEARVLELLARPRLYSTMLVGFAAAAIGIAAVGLFGVLSFNVAQRSRELAVRAAVGASPASLLGLVLRQGLAVTASGLAIGLLAALLLVESLERWLYGVTARDPWTFALAALALLGISAAAAAAPAVRAARLDPLVVLKRG